MTGPDTCVRVTALSRHIHRGSSLSARSRKRCGELAYAALLVCLWSGQPLAAPAEPDIADVADGMVERAPEAFGAGVIEIVEHATRTVILEGYRYRLALTLGVEQGGVIADIASLAPGTRVQFRYLRHPAGLPEITAMRVVADGVEIYRQ